MKLLTDNQREQLLANGTDRDRDRRPVVKFFDPSGAGTWLFADLDPQDGDTLYGLADLGFGTPELGYTSLAEIASIRGRFDLGIERGRLLRAEAFAVNLRRGRAESRADRGIRAGA